MFVLSLPELNIAFEAWKQGDHSALETVFSLAYPELLMRAQRQCGKENPNMVMLPDELISLLFQTYLTWKKRDFATIDAFFNALEKGMKILLARDMQKKRQRREDRWVSLDDLLENEGGEE